MHRTWTRVARFEVYRQAGKSLERLALWNKIQALAFKFLRLAFSMSARWERLRRFEAQGTTPKHLSRAGSECPTHLVVLPGQADVGGQT